MVYYIGLGTNIGDKECNVQRALELLECRGRVLRRSQNFYSEPWGFVSPNSFLNIVVAFDTLLGPFELLDYTQQIEREMGRTKKSVGGVYSDRVIDIDLLMYEGDDNHSERLQIPHPLIAQRYFVYIPFREVQQQEMIE